MLHLTSLRALYRIPWIRKNREGIRDLNELFYLMIALYRCRRFNDLKRLQRLYFKMIDSFAQYGRVEAKETIDRLLTIPWFRDHRRELYQVISASNRVIEAMSGNNDGPPGSSHQQADINRSVRDFVDSMKALIHYDGRDDVRVNRLIESSGQLDTRLKEIFELVA